MDRLTATTKMAIVSYQKLIEREGGDPKTEGWGSLQSDDKADFVKQMDDALEELIELGAVDPAVFDK